VAISKRRADCAPPLIADVRQPMPWVESELLGVRQEHGETIVEIGMAYVPFWNDKWRVSHVEPKLTHTPSLGSFNVGSRHYRLEPDIRFRYEEYRPRFGFIYPRPHKLLLSLPDAEVQVAMSQSDATLDEIEQAMRRALAKWANLGSSVV